MTTLHRDPDYNRVHTSSADKVLWHCGKCKKVIGDSNYSVKIVTHEPKCHRARIICKNCKAENFVSHA